MSASDKLPCDYCGRLLEAEALVAIPSPPYRAGLACPLCAAKNSWEKERAEQEAADQVEEERVARTAPREEAELAEEAAQRKLAPYPTIPPYLFADECSQRRAEEEARFYDPIDDYAAWQGMAPPNEQLFR